jgi:hypothetical protein
MWGLMKEWLVDQPAQIPNNNELMADICSCLYKYDSKTRLLIEGKEAMKKRGVRSSDGADALCLTFALPDFGLIKRQQAQHSAFGKQMSQSVRNFDKLKQKAYGD